MLASNSIFECQFLPKYRKLCRPLHRKQNTAKERASSTSVPSLFRCATAVRKTAMRSSLVVALAFSTLFVRPCRQIVVRIKPVIVAPSGISTPSREKFGTSPTTSAAVAAKSSKLTSTGTGIATGKSRRETAIKSTATLPVQHGNAFTRGSSLSRKSTTATTFRTIESSKKNESTTATTPASSTQATVVAGRPAVVGPKPIKVEPLIDNANVNSYCGHFVVESQGRLFYWFVMSANNASKAPLVVWIQGQPNASSLYGAFDETGPYRVDSPNDKPKLRTYAWTSNFNVLYLDHHPDCGFSYWSKSSEKYPHSLWKIAKNLYTALSQFYASFPQYVANDLYIAAESVGARYAVTLAYVIHGRNHPGRRIPLKGLFVSNGLLEGCHLMHHAYVLHLFGIIDSRTRDALRIVEDDLQALLRAGKYKSVSDMWHSRIPRTIEAAGFNSLYDARDTNAFWNSRVPVLFNRTAVKAKYRMSRRVFKPATKRKYFDSDDLTPFYPLVRDVLSHTKVLFLNSQYDMLAECLTDDIFTILTGSMDQNLSPYQATQNGSRTHLLGHTLAHGNFTQVNVLHAGHNIGVSRPDAMYQLLNDYVNNNIKLVEKIADE